MVSGVNVTQLMTTIDLKPGHLSRRVLHEALRLAMVEFNWFVPTRYSGTGKWKEQPIKPGSISIREWVDCYDDPGPAIGRWIRLFERKDEDDFLVLGTTLETDPHPHSGAVNWYAGHILAEDAAWAERHLREVTSLMRLLDSPLAFSAHVEDSYSKNRRRVPSDVGTEEVSNVSDYSEGLAGVYWRNFYGPPFVDLFGDRLGQLPAGTRQELEGGIVLVQPYALPTEAFTEAGKAREREFIQLLGPECFFDHGQVRPPTRRPRLPASWIPG